MIKHCVQIVERSPYGRAYYRTVLATLDRVKAEGFALRYEQLGRMVRVVQKETRA